MATMPTMTGPRVAAAGGQVPQGPQTYLDAGFAGTPAAQGGAIAAGLGAFGQQVEMGSRAFAQQALQEQALQNEAMARDGDSTAATGMANIYNEFATLEGEKAVAAKDDFMGRMATARTAALDTMPNPEARRMLDAVLTRRMGFYQESIGRYAAQQAKVWQSRSAQGAARVQVDQAAVFRNVPDLVESNVEAGVGYVRQQGEIHGWDENTVQAETASYRGRAYQQIIGQMLGDGNVDGAAALYDRVRTKLDAGSQAQIAQALRPHQQRQQTQMDFASAMGTGRGTATTMFDAIMAQESGGRDGQVSVDGARGAMQITPGTFAQWAQPGEDIDNPEHNRTVGRRIIAAYEAQYNDPERVAVAYFSGPGNVAPPGSPTPWKEDKRDGNGMTVSRYVAQVTGRLKRDTEAAPAYQRPDFDAARERVPSIAGDDPDRQQRLYARINQAETQYNSTTRAERENLGARLTDVNAALLDGRAVQIPETEIRRLYPKAKADEIMGQMTEAQQQGYAMQSVAMASPAEFAALLAGYDDVGRAEGGTDAELQPGYAQRAKARERLVQAWQRRQEMLKQDPASYAGRAPAVAALATPEALAAPGGAEAYARASLGEQERLGVPEADRRVMPKAVTAGLVAKVMQADPEKTPAALVLQQLGKEYGGMWPAVFRDMVRGGLPAEYAILGSMDHPDQVGARGDAQRMLALRAQKGGENTLRESVGDKFKAKGIDDGLDAALSDFFQTTQYATGGPELRGRVREFVRDMAYYYAGQGASAAQALKYATTGVLGAKYDFDGTMRVPKGQLPLARETTSVLQANLKADDLAPVADGPIAPEQRANLLRVAQNGFWVPNADDTGLVLMGLYKVSETGMPVYMPVKRNGGANVEVRFGEMQALRTAQQARGEMTVRPDRMPIDALGNPVLVAPR